MKPQITPKDIAAACHAIGLNPSHFKRSRLFPGTPKRRRAAILAEGRNVLAALLIQRHGLKPHQLTAAIRLGHAGEATDFEAINIAGAKALGIWEE